MQTLEKILIKTKKTLQKASRMLQKGIDSGNRKGKSFDLGETDRAQLLETDLNSQGNDYSWVWSFLDGVSHFEQRGYGRDGKRSRNNAGTHK